MKTNGLKQRFIGAASWTLAGHGVSQVIRLGSNLVLTRLLAPELYGLMAVGYMVIVGLSMFSDIGLGANAIQSRRGDDPVFLNVTWVVQIVRGAIITVAALALSGLVGFAANSGWLPAHSVYADPQIPTLIAVVSLSGLISGFESTKTAWSRRHLSMGIVTKIEIASQVATTVFQLCWAFIAPSLWTLAVGWLFGSLVKTIFTHVFLPGPPNRFQWERAAFHEVFHFGKWVFLSSSFSFLLTSGDRILLGAMLDSKTMGLYAVAFLLVSALQAALVRVIGFTVLPALGEVYRERPHQLKQTIYRIRRPLDAVCLLSAGALVMLGPHIVDVLYDRRYAAAGWMLSVLAMTLVATRLDVFDQCLIATARVRLLSLLNAWRLVSMYSLVSAGYMLFGAHGAIVAVAVSAVANASAVLVLQARVGLLDLRKELLAVPLFGAGLLFGWGASRVIHLIR